MRDFNKDKFNESIRGKFANAEVQPGNSVWEGIEAGLLKQENVKMQKRAVFYRNVAAAVIFIALISIYFNLQDFGFGANSIQSVVPIELDGQNDQIFVSEKDVIIAKPEVASVNNQTKLGSSDNVAALKQRFESVMVASAAVANKSGGESVAVNSSAAKVNENTAQSNQSPVFEEKSTIAFVAQEEDLGILLSKLDSKAPEDIHLPKLEMDVKSVSYFAVSDLDKSKDRSGIAWNTNVNIGSGNFDPNSEITGTPLFSTVSTLNNPGTAGRTLDDIGSINSKQEREAVKDLSSAPMEGNISFTVGLNFGVNLNERWNIKSGLQYGAYRSTSLSSTVLRDRNSDQLFPYHGASSSTEIADGRVVNVTSEYELYNDFQILTIPLMASYKIIDRKFDVALVAGLSADFIIRNTLKGGSEQINDIKFSQNDRQSYRHVFGSGLAGIEISYPFADRYALSIMPSYKKALSNVTTKNATFDSMPAFMGLNMSLTYSL